jgi:hypothetical protein
MSQQKEYEIRCPKCAHEQTVQLYESINVQASPELKDRLLHNRLNLVECENCKVSFRVDKPLLYSDPALRLMIYLIPLKGSTVEEGCAQFAECIKRVNEILPQDIPVPNIHLVFSQVELVERIFLVEADLNERVIEYIKYLIYGKNVDRLKPEDKILLFNAEDSTPEKLCFVVQDAKTRRLESVLHFSRDAYKSLLEMFDSDEHTPNLFELFPGPYINARLVLLKELEQDSSSPGRPEA